MKNTFSYFVFALLILIFSLGCKKNKNSEPNYTYGMGGTRIWHGIDEGYGHYGVGTPAYHYSDTLNDTFAIQIINNTTVSFWGQTSTWDHTDTDNKVNYFNCKVKLNSGYTYGTLAYYYTENKMEIYFNVGLYPIQEDYSLKTP